MYRAAFLSTLFFLAPLQAQEMICSPPVAEPVPYLIDLDTALQKVFDNTPSIVAAELETQIREAQALQASLWPNPEFAAEFDKFGGRRLPGPGDVTAAEYTYSVTQLFELGGKREARVSVAESQKCVSEWQLEMLKLDLRHQTIAAMVIIFAEQERVRLAAQRRQTYAEIFESIKSKVDAGKLSIVQQHQAEMALVKAEHAVEHSLRGFEASKFKLIALWNCPEQFDGVTYPFFDLIPPPPLCELEGDLLSNPDVIRWDAEIDAAEENYGLQKAEQIPDLLVTAGIVDVKESRSAAGTLEFVIPLPIFNRNQGNIAMSQYQIIQAEAKREALIHGLTVDLSSAYQDWQCSYHEAVSLRDKILSKAKVTLETVQEGYRLGKFELIDLLNAQQVYTEAEEEYIRVLMEYHDQKAHVERLIGRTID